MKRRPPPAPFPAPFRALLAEIVADQAARGRPDGRTGEAARLLSDARARLDCTPQPRDADADEAACHHLLGQMYGEMLAQRGYDVPTDALPADLISTDPDTQELYLRLDAALYGAADAIAQETERTPR